MMFVDSSGKIIDKGEIRAARYAFYGASTRNLAVITELGIADQVICYFDSDKSKWGEMLDGYEIHSIKDIETDADIKIISVLTDYIEDVSATIKSSGYKECYFYFPFDTKSVYEMNDHVVKTLKKSYKYIHFFNNDKFINYFYSMVDENFDMLEHLFIVDFIDRNSDKGFISFKEIDQWNKQYHNILVFYDIESIEFVADYNSNSFLYSREILDLFQNSEKIWLHSAWFGRRFLQFVSGLLDQIPEKIRWICHGGEADVDKNDDIYKCVISKVQNAYAGKAEGQSLMKNFCVKAKLLPCGYLYLSKSLIKRMTYSKKAGDDIYILLGHSAEEFNNQLPMLDVLKRFSEENIKIICPLAYGNMEYADRVVKMGKELFGKKFLPIMNFQKAEVYYKMLWRVDVAIFPMTTRFAGGTTIDFLNTIGKKIYVHDKYLKQSPNLLAVSISKINDMTFSEFILNKEPKSEDKYAALSEKRKEQVIRWKQLLDS